MVMEQLKNEHSVAKRRPRNPSLLEPQAPRSDPDGNLLTELTVRERIVLSLIAESHSTKEIANILGITFKTAVTHRTHIMEKLDLHDVAALTRFAIRCGIVQA